MRHIVLWIMLCLIPVLSPAEEAAFLAGVLRSDGIIVPIAAFDGSRWETPWPEAGAVPDTAFASLDSLPREWYAPLAEVPREWYVRTESGGFRAAAVDRPVGIAAGDQTAVGLRTGLAGRPDRPAETRSAPFGTSPRRSGSTSRPTGFVVSRNIETRAALPVGNGSSEWSTLVSAIRRAFDEAEEKRGHPLPAESRVREELRVLALFRAGTAPDGSSVYSFEAARDYVTAGLLPVTSPAGCSRLRGWIRRDRTGAPSFMEREFVLERFAAPLEPAILPLGTINTGAKTFLLARESNSGNDAYVVFEIERRGIRGVASAYTGGR